MIHIQLGSLASRSAKDSLLMHEVQSGVGYLKGRPPPLYVSKSPFQEPLPTHDQRGEHSTALQLFTGPVAEHRLNLRDQLGLSHSHLTRYWAWAGHPPQPCSCRRRRLQSP